MPFTVLCVDDVPSSRLLLTEILKRRGYKTISAENGSKALKIIRANKNLGLLIVDYEMPKMDGAELARRVKQLRPQLPIMMLTGYDVRHNTLKSVDIYVEKGWPTDYFTSVVGTLSRSPHRR
jgi:CheY-like chemotaxis protein